MQFPHSLAAFLLSVRDEALFPAVPRLLVFQINQDE